jgi:glycine betaine/proline transport system substrate-binding protein
MKKYGLMVLLLAISSLGFAQVKLCENAWSGSSVNAYVAKILLEEKLGKTVEIVSIDENSMWAAIATGDISACLELWPSGHQANVAQYIDGTKEVENIGELGVVGKIAWYVPTYLLTDHPELATWEGLKSADAAKLFATAQTGDKGQFIGGDPSFVQYDEQIIENLGLDFQVVFSGSEQAELAGLDAAYSRNEPFLFYFWTPHSVHAKYDLTEVQLPAYSDDCYAKIDAGGVDCAYPEDALFKIAWSGLKDADPESYALLKNISYSNADQIGMIAEVDSGAKTAEEAARAWIDANEAVWSTWLPQ